MTENMRQFLLALNNYDKLWLTLCDLVEKGCSQECEKRHLSLIDAQKTVIKNMFRELEQ